MPRRPTGRSGALRGSGIPGQRIGTIHIQSPQPHPLILVSRDEAKDPLPREHQRFNQLSRSSDYCVALQTAERSSRGSCVCVRAGGKRIPELIFCNIFARSIQASKRASCNRHRQKCASSVLPACLSQQARTSTHTYTHSQRTACKEQQRFGRIFRIEFVLF